MLQQQEALLQQQVASLRTEVEELEGSAGAKASQSQSVFRDAPPLRVRARAAGMYRGCEWHGACAEFAPAPHAVVHQVADRAVLRLELPRTAEPSEC